MSADGVKKFIAAVDLIYPAPQYGGDRARQGAWAMLYVQALADASDEVLAAAAQEILHRRDEKKNGKFFPSIKECLAATHEVAERLERARTPLLEAPKEIPYEARCNLARDLMQSPLGKLANKEGWGTRMYHFCVEHQRVPGGKEVDQCREEQRHFDAAYKECLKGDHPQGGPLAKLAEGMIRKARDVMGGKAA
jgi:hypothetical protein